MQRFQDIADVLLAYPANCQPRVIQPLGGSGGFSGASLWRLTASRGELCLRRWPLEQSESRLEWTQGVIGHVSRCGFRLLPAPIATRGGQGFLRFDDYLWELTPWLPGRADYWSDRRPERLSDALLNLARFHRASESFPERLTDFEAFVSVSSLTKRPSPGIAERKSLAARLHSGYLAELREAIASNSSAIPELVQPAVEFLQRATPHLHWLEQRLDEASRLRVSLQPCLRDVWHDHVLFIGDRVSGMVDVGSMRMENVAGDVSRLLESLCGNDVQNWSIGMAAYEAVRPLSTDEHLLVDAFRSSQLLLAGVKWVEWVFVERRSFADPTTVVRRMEHILSRLSAAFSG